MRYLLDTADGLASGTHNVVPGITSRPKKLRARAPVRSQRKAKQKMDNVSLPELSLLEVIASLNQNEHKSMGQWFLMSNSGIVGKKT